MIEDYYYPIYFVEKRSTPDGMGGFIESWVQGAEFMGSITTDNRMETRIAAQQGVKALYTVTIPTNVPLKYNDVIKRKSDNETFRITSRPQDMTTPRMANMQFIQLNAELYTLN